MLEPTPDIAAITARRGDGWSHDDKVAIEEWLNTSPQLNSLRVFALLHLGTNAAWADAEDAWADFVADRELEETMVRFDPSRAAFPSWLLLRFKQFCWRRAPTIKSPGPPASVGFGGGSAEFVYTPTPFDDVHLQEMTHALVECLNQLPGELSQVFSLYYQLQQAVATIADELLISPSLVKVRLWRGRGLLRTCLKKKGFKP